MQNVSHTFSAVIVTFTKMHGIKNKKKNFDKLEGIVYTIQLTPETPCPRFSTLTKMTPPKLALTLKAIVKFCKEYFKD